MSPPTLGKPKSQPNGSKRWLAIMNGIEGEAEYHMTDINYSNFPQGFAPQILENTD